MKTDSKLKAHFVSVWPHLNETARRQVAANEAVQLGYGGVSRVSRKMAQVNLTL